MDEIVNEYEELLLFYVAIVFLKPPAEETALYRGIFHVYSGSQ